MQWKQIGPAPLVINPANGNDGKGPDSGTVVDIAIDPRGTTDQVIYIAVGSGGIWKTTDGGTTWKPKTDFMPTLSVGAVALDPTNPSIVYAGTGNPANNGGFFDARGLYKSTDEGDSWIVLNPSNLFTKPAQLSIRRIVLPAHDVLIVATSQGLFRSIDGGQHFGANSPLFNDGNAVLTGFISDVKVDTASSSTIYAAAVQGGSGAIYRSTNSGATFSPTPFFASSSVPATNPPTVFSFIAFTQSTKPNNQTFYANVDVGPGAASVFKSADGGSIWTVVAANPFPGELQNFYDQTIGVDPQDANRVYFGLRALYESKDGGATGFAPANRIDLNVVHADQHALTFSPQSHWGGGGPPTRLYNGTDGGIATTPDQGANWTLLNDGLATMLFYQIDIGRGSAANNKFTYGAAQDLGLSSNNRAGLTGLQWLEGIFNDGFSIAVDPLNPTHAIGNQNAFFMVSTPDGKANWPNPGNAFPPNLAPPLTPAGQPFITTVAFDPNGSRAYVMGALGNANVLFQSTNSGTTFTVMHTFPQNLTNPINISKLDSNIVWVALTDGTLQRTANALSGAASTWTSVSVNSFTAPNGAVSGIAIDPGNTDEVVVVYPGFSTLNVVLGRPTGHVFQTTDNGNNWTDISANLPDIPLTAVVIDPGTIPHGIVVAGWGGVFRSVDAGATWEVLGDGLPNAFCTALAFDPDASPPLLRVGTFGRSAFELTSGTGLAVNADLDFGTVCSNQSPTRVVQIFNVGSTDLHISSFTRISGSPDFQIISGPPTPVTILPGEEIDYTIRFHPLGIGNETATFEIDSDDPTLPARIFTANGTGGAGRIATVVADTGNFGNVCVGTFDDLALTISNGGTCDLSVSAIASSSPDFLVPATLSFPLVIQAGTSLQVPIRFAATSPGAHSANITISSNDPTTPSKVVAVSGNAPLPFATTSGALDFGQLCVGESKTETVQLCDTGQCNLLVTGAALVGPNCAGFTLVSPTPASLPLTISPDFCFGFVVKFSPTSLAAPNCSLVITTNDPAHATVTFPITATVGAPHIVLDPTSLSGIYAFPATVVDPNGSLACFSDRSVVIRNNGTCPLNISGINATAPFHVIAPTQFPVILPPGEETLKVGVRFAPTTGGGSPTAPDQTTGTLTVTSNDPGGPAAETVCGEATVQSGVRVLVVDGTDTPINGLDSLTLTSKGLHTPQPISIKLTNAPVATAAVCGKTIRYHLDSETLPPTQTTGSSPNSSYILGAKEKNKQVTQSFTLGQCEFKELILKLQ